MKEESLMNSETQVIVTCDMPNSMTRYMQIFTKVSNLIISLLMSVEERSLQPIIMSLIKVIKIPFCKYIAIRSRLTFYNKSTGTVS